MQELETANVNVEARQQCLSDAKPLKSERARERQDIPEYFNVFDKSSWSSRPVSSH